MAETGKNKEESKPSIWDTLASTQGAPSQNNGGWDQSDGWGQSLNNDGQQKSDGWGMSSNKKEPDHRSWTRSRVRSPGRGRNSKNVTRSSRSCGGDFRHRIDRGGNWKEESPSPPYHGRNAPRDFRRYRDSKEEASKSPRRSTPYSRREASRPDWGKRGESSAWRQTDHPVSRHSRFKEHNYAERSPGKERHCYSPNTDIRKSQGTSPAPTNRTQVAKKNKSGSSFPRLTLPDLNDGNGHGRWGPGSPAMIRSRSRSSSPWSQAAHDVKKSGKAKESDRWGPSSLHVDRSRSRSLSPWSRAAHDAKQNCDNKETDGWGTALDQTGPDAWNQSRFNLSPDRGFNSRRGGWGSSPKWRGTGRNLDRSRGRAGGFSPENRQRRSGWDQGGSWSRGRGRTSSPGNGIGGRVKDEAFTQDLQISSQTHRDVKGKAVMNKLEIENATIGSNHLPLSCDPWNNDVLIPSSHTMAILSENLEASQPLSIQKNPIMGSTAEASRSMFCSQKSNATTPSLATNPLLLAPWSGLPDSLQKSHCSTWGPSTGPFNYPALEQKMSIAATSSLLNLGGPISNSVPIGEGPPQIGMLNAVSSTSSAVPEAGFSKPSTIASMQFISCTDTKAGTSEAGGADAEAVSSSINRVDPTPAVSNEGTSQPNQNPITAAGAKTDKDDNLIFKLVLIEFAKAKLRPFWVKQHLTKERYLLILKKFVHNVDQSLGTRAPQTDKDSREFLKEQDVSLSNLLQMYLRRFLSEEVIEAMRGEGN